MGYYTNYTLTWEPNNPEVSVFIEARQEEDQAFCYGITPEGEMSDSCKWYEHDDDLKLISNTFPDILFTLHGEGEEAGDVWNTYYKGGKFQRAKAEIVIAPFDETKLR